MGNRVLIRVLLATLFAFMLYSANLKRVQNTKVKVIEPQINKQAAKHSRKEPKITQPQAPKISSAEYSTKVTVEKGSQQTLAKRIETIMGTKNSYQVAVQDLNNSSRYARLANSNRVHNVDQTMILYLLLGIYHQEQTGKLTARSSIKIAKADQVKGEKMLQTNMAYGIQYLRQAMMNGNKTAANALLRKVGPSYINSLAKKSGAEQTVLLNKFSQTPVGKTTADDLCKTLIGVYQTKVLNRQHAYQLLGALHNKNELATGLKGTVYSIGDSNSAAAIVQYQGKSYAIAVWSNTNHQFKQLGQTVTNFFEKHH